MSSLDLLVQRVALSIAAPMALAALVISSTTLAGDVEARSITVRPDGLGDAPTLQAGVDSLFWDPVRRCNVPDTLFVMPGFYDETVRMNFSQWLCREIHVIGTGGPASTPVRAFRFDDCDPLDCRPAARVTFRGLRILDPVRQGPEQRQFRWEQCDFESGLISTIGPTAYSDMVIDGCTFRGPTLLSGCRITVQRSRFVRAKLTLTPSYSVSWFSECSFEGPVDTAVVIMPRNSGDPRFSACVFSNAGYGVAFRQPGGGYNVRTQFAGCRFSDIDASAIDLSDEDWSCHRLDYLISVAVDSSRFERCGTAVRWPNRCNSRVSLQADTVFASRETAIDVVASQFDMRRCVVERAGGDGVRVLTHASQTTFMPRLMEITDCVLSESRGSGLRILATLQESEERSLDVRVRGNTSVSNGSAGVEVVVDGPSRTGITIENNLLAGNGGDGIRFSGDPVSGASIRHNNAWRNAGLAYAGLGEDDGPNLEVDPRFCDVRAGNFHVGSSSPCAPSGPFGQIGALGVGCDASAIGVEVGRGLSGTAPAAGHGNLSVALLGHRLFDPLSVDPGSATIDGARPREARGTPRTHVHDLDGDGIADLVFAFRGEEIEGGATLLARTFEGAPLVGTIPLRTGRREPRPFQATMPVLALRSVERATTSGLLVHAMLATDEPALIEVLDISGRRISRETVSRAPGEHTLHVNASPPSGIYFVRLRQGAAEVTSKAILLR